ncbi:GAF domain-containing protein [Marivirga sp. S37H4]|uniref:GAF domain-containing protein n=1 Tax=Marivirga aurantiaca TaxID=2802615 RepID=A0A934WV85_9BACT|nr:GAF domain-containing protein [Marivirga aurantiaca]MBK6263658.1 GAF domain-containing protein [Marivirga aurantiaca]
MKAVYKNLALILSLIFTLSIIGLAYYLYIFPERIANQTSLISLMDVSELKPVLTELYLFCGASLALGFTAILFLIFAKNSENDSNIVYIEKFKDKKKDKGNGANSEDNESIVDDELVDISKAIGQEKDVKKQAELLLSLLAKKLEASQGAIYKAGKEEKKNIISLFASYAFVLPESQTISYEFGEGLAGQVAKEKKLINISDVPKGYINILSGLGEAKPSYLIICPIMKDSQLLGVAEIASFKKFSTHDEKLVESAVHLLAGSLIKKDTDKSDKTKS